MASDRLTEIIEQLAKNNPDLLKGLETLAAGGLQTDKIAIYELLVKNNTTFTYEALNKILLRHENSRLDINWNKEDYIYRIVISRRKRIPEKPKKERTKKGGNNNASTEQTTQGQSSSA